MSDLTVALKLPSFFNRIFVWPDVHLTSGQDWITSAVRCVLVPKCFHFISMEISGYLTIQRTPLDTRQWRVSPLSLPSQYLLGTKSILTLGHFHRAMEPMIGGTAVRETVYEVFNLTGSSYASSLGVGVPDRLRNPEESSSKASTLICSNIFNIPFCCRTCFI